MTIKVYIAGAYAERERVLRSMDQVRDCGREDHLELVHDWVAVIDEVMGGDQSKEAELSVETRRKHALVDLRHAHASNVFWLLVPEKGGRGCWFESGAVYAGPRRARVKSVVPPPIMIASGPHVGVTIFTELFNYKFASDADAFDFIFNGWAE